jgi:hypothetical protein
MQIGTKVRVTIPDDKAHTWARNYLLAVQGRTGVVIDIVVNSLETKSLVLFDDPPIDPSPMAPRERKLTQFWIQDASLTRVEK